MKKLVITMLFLILATLLVVAGCTQGTTGQTTHNAVENEGDAMQKTDNVMEKTDPAMEKTDDAMMEEGFSGNELTSGTKSPYIEFNKADFDKAKSEGKTILLYFYASWCPTCKAAQPTVIEAFNNLDNENVVGFRVNYRDSDTDSFEEDLAKQYGISYQHTKVIINAEGDRLLKSPETWTSERYVSELNKVA